MLINSNMSSQTCLMQAFVDISQGMYHRCKIPNGVLMHTCLNHQSFGEAKQDPREKAPEHLQAELC